MQGNAITLQYEVVFLLHNRLVYIISDFVLGVIGLGRMNEDGVG